MVRAASPTDSSTGRRVIPSAGDLGERLPGRDAAAPVGRDDRAAPMLAAERRRRGLGPIRSRPAGEPLD